MICCTNPIVNVSVLASVVGPLAGLVWLAHLAGAMADDDVAFLAPMPVQGHLQAADRDRIFQVTGCNVGTKQRKNWASICWTVGGPPQHLAQAPPFNSHRHHLLL